MTDDDRSNCYRVKLPCEQDARRQLGMKPHPNPHRLGIDEPATGWLCGRLGTPCFHCGGVPDVLCDFWLIDDGKTCDRSLCSDCAPNIDSTGAVVPPKNHLPEADYKNYCREHSGAGRQLLRLPALQFPSSPRATAAAKPARAKPLPKAPPGNQRWRVRQGSDGAVLTSWTSEIEARRFAVNVRGYVETWEEFVVMWRALYPLKSKPRRSP